MKKTILALSIIMVFSGIAMALGWSGAVSITSIQASDTSSGLTTPQTYLKFNTAPHPNTGCTQDPSGWWAINNSGTTSSSEQARNLLNMAISAKAAGRQVLVLFNSGSAPNLPTCLNGYPVIAGLQIL